MLNIVPRAVLSASELQDIHHRIMAKLGGGFKLTLKPVASIPPTKRGKHRFLNQHLNLMYGEGGITVSS